MTQRLLRHIPTGILHAYQPAFAVRPDFEEVIDVETRVVEVTDVVEKPARRAKKAAAEVAPTDEAAIQADASRGLP